MVLCCIPIIHRFTATRLVPCIPGIWIPVVAVMMRLWRVAWCRNVRGPVAFHRDVTLHRVMICRTSTAIHTALALQLGRAAAKEIMDHHQAHHHHLEKLAARAAAVEVTPHLEKLAKLAAAVEVTPHLAKLAARAAVTAVEVTRHLARQKDHHIHHHTVAAMAAGARIIPTPLPCRRTPARIIIMMFIRTT